MQTDRPIASCVAVELSVVSKLLTESTVQVIFAVSRSVLLYTCFLVVKQNSAIVGGTVHELLCVEWVWVVAAGTPLCNILLVYKDLCMYLIGT